MGVERRPFNAHRVVSRCSYRPSAPVVVRSNGRGVVAPSFVPIAHDSTTHSTHFGFLFFGDFSSSPYAHGPVRQPSLIALASLIAPSGWRLLTELNPANSTTSSIILAKALKA